MILCFVLLGCNTPGPEFVGLTATHVTVDGSEFDVRIKSGKAEALRTNAQYAPRLGVIEFRARAAMEQVSGCKVTRIKGDQAVLTGTLKCPGSAPPVVPVIRPGRLDCYLVDSYISGATGELINDFDCTWED